MLTCLRMPGAVRMAALIVALLLVSAGCGGEPSANAEGPGATALARTGTPITIIGAGDIAGDGRDAAATADLIRAANPDAVFTTGDNAYDDGSASDYANYYDPTWGSFKDRTHPVPGNHEYNDSDAAGYVDYFGADAVTNPVDGGLYYAWDVGNGWRAYALNTEISTTGAQLAWLKGDVAAHPGQHYILYTHHPRFTSGAEHSSDTTVCPLWDTLAATGGLEMVLFGHNHQYERFAPMDCNGQTGPNGVPSFVVGSGGKDLYGFGAMEAGSEFQNASDLGVLELVLYQDSYEWQFIAAGRAQGGTGTLDTGDAGAILDKGAAAV